MIQKLALVAALAIATVLSVTPDTTLEARIEGAFFGALVADGLTLGSHYEYDAKKIKQAYGGTISQYMAPGEQMGGQTHGVGWGARNYHPGTVKGDQTDYGYGNTNRLIDPRHATHHCNRSPCFEESTMYLSWNISRHRQTILSHSI